MKKKITLLAMLTMCGVLMAGTAAAQAWQTPCVSEPHDHHYEDEVRCISINKIERDGAVCYVADVQLADAAQFRAALAGEGMQPLSELAQGAVLAVNGDDYGTHRYGTIIRNGELLRTAKTTRHMLIVEESGDLSLRTKRRDENPEVLGAELKARNVRQAFEFGPALVEGGKACTFDRAFDVISTKKSRREPRMAIGQIGPLHYVVVVADGRQPGYSKGMTLPALQELFLELGAQTAINLDGGGSAEMWFMGEVISRPSGGEERRLSDAICF